MSTTTTQLLSSGKFCKLRYDTISVKRCVCKRFYTSNSKMPNFELYDSLVTNEGYMFYKLNLKSGTMLLAAVAGDI
jgi:hypothetical protein